MLLTILRFPDERLRIKASLVDCVDEAIRLLIDKMFFTMYAEEGIGLAATQVNVHRRVIVVDVSENRDQPIALVNPVITEASGVVSYEEGCLSVPDIRSSIRRSNQITLSGLDKDGKLITFEATGLLAVCLQHELDHLDGKLFTDYLSPIKRLRLREELKSRYKQ